MSRKFWITDVRVLIGAFAVLLFANLAAADDAKINAAQKSAEVWTQLIDSGNYGESWEQASEPFKKSVAKERWIDAAKQARAPLGKATSRKLTDSNYATQLEGAPAGEYVTLQYQTSFEKMSTAAEIVHFMLAPDGTWRAVGYVIK